MLRINKKWKIILFGSIFYVIVFHFFGLINFFFEKSFSDFELVRNGEIRENADKLTYGQKPDKTPFNFYNYRFKNNNPLKCQTDESKVRLVYLIKSAVANKNRRETIRVTWGFEKRFSDVEVRTVFILGRPKDKSIQDEVDDEARIKKDIIQADFIDDYFNNTVKTMMAITWVMKYCPEAKLYFFSDDDMYVSTKNVLRFARNPIDYPNYLTKDGKQLRQPDFDLPDDAELYAGYVFPDSRPQRHMSSKWYVTVAEYPYNRWPPYVTAGAFMLSNLALRKFYFASGYVEHFRFDDIYLGFLAWHLRITPLNCKEFYFYKKECKDNSYQYVVASHGYDDPNELERVWTIEKSAGNA